MYLYVNQAAIIEVQGRRRSAVTPTSGASTMAIRFFKAGHASDGYYWTSGGGGAWQSGAVTVVTTVEDQFAHQFTLPAAAIVAGMEHGRVTARISHPADYGETVWFDVVLTTNVDIIRVVESQRGHHTGKGNVYYWDPINGNDSNNGLTEATAKLTWGGVSGANSLVVANNHDIVIIVPGEAAGTTVITEQIVIDKEYTFLRGSGRDVRFLPSATTGVTVAIDAEGVELSGVRVDTASTGDGDAIEISGSDFGRINFVWIEQCRGDGVRIQNVNHAKLKDVHIRNCVGDAVLFRGITQDCKYNILSDCILLSNSGDGVHFEGTNCQHNHVWGGEDGISIKLSGGWGINETDSADYNCASGPVIHVSDNVLGDINLTGTNSGFENVNDIADAVWDETLASHLSTGSTGAALNSAAPVGQRQIRIHVQDGVAAPIEGVHVSIYDSGNTAFKTRGTTDPNGNYDVNLDDATYSVRLSLSLYGFASPETIVVTADGTKTITGTAFTAPTAADPGNCAVYGTIWDSEGNPMAGAQIDVYATTSPQFVDDITMGDRLGTTHTSAIGEFTIDLLKGAEVRFVVADAGIDYTRTVPNAASVAIEDWT